MTQQRDLKRRIRERMLATGETYVTARQHVLAARKDAPPDPAVAPERAFDVVEPVDVSDHARALDLKCRAVMFPKLAARVDATRALARLRDALVGTTGDGELTVMRRLVLHGAPPPVMRERARLNELRSFVRRAQSGIGGTSPGGRMVALSVDDVMMVCVAAATRQRDPIVYMQSSDELIGQGNFLVHR